MRLILTAPAPSIYKGREIFDNHKLGKVFADYLYLQGIWIGDPKTYGGVGWEFSCNPAHKFYDLKLLEHIGNGAGARTTHWDAVEKFLKDSGYRYTRSDNHWTWLFTEGDRIEGKAIYVQGCRFFIYPKG